MLHTVITLATLRTLLFASSVHQLPRLGYPLDKQIETLVTSRRHPDSTRRALGDRQTLTVYGIANPEAAMTSVGQYR